MFLPSLVLAGAAGHGFRPAKALPVIDERELASAARSGACILFTGPVNARMLALRIHRLSSGHPGSFKAVDCTAPESALERELFAVLADDLVPPDIDGSSARMLQAETLFLHEIGSLGAGAQARLRDLLAERGSDRVLGPQRRIMAWTSEPLLPRVRIGAFDDRLFYQLNVIHFILAGNRG